MMQNALYIDEILIEMKWLDADKQVGFLIEHQQDRKSVV